MLNICVMRAIRAETAWLRIESTGDGLYQVVRYARKLPGVPTAVFSSPRLGKKAAIAYRDTLLIARVYSKLTGVSEERAIECALAKPYGTVSERLQAML